MGREVTDRELGFCYRSQLPEFGGELSRQCSAPRPDVTERAAGILEVFLLNQTQVIADSGCFIGVNHATAKDKALVRGVEPDEDWWNLWAVVESVWRECMNKKDDSES